jgi:hypothetical protein
MPLTSPWCGRASFAVRAAVEPADDPVNPQRRCTSAWPAELLTELSQAAQFLLVSPLSPALTKSLDSWIGIVGRACFQRR